jgi:hypothetical protein
MPRQRSTYWRSESEKELFSVVGSVREIDGKLTFVPKSGPYFRQMLRYCPKDKPVLATFSTKVPSRSRAQLAYHWVLVHLIADTMGESAEDVHDAIMREKFGEKEIRVGWFVKRVRKSVSDRAKMPKFDMSELIEFDLKICKFLGLVVPTPEQLGYIANYPKVVQ